MKDVVNQCLEFARLPVSWREFLGSAVCKKMMINGMVRNDVSEGGVGWVEVEGRGGGCHTESERG